MSQSYTLPVLALLSLLLTAPAAAGEEIVILRSDGAAAYDAPVERLQSSLNLKPVVHDLRGEKENAQRVAERIGTDPPRLIVALGPKAAWTARTWLPEVPLVYLMVPDPERYGVSGDNVTGVAQEVSAAESLAQFQLFAPGVQRIGVLISQDSLASAEAAEAAEAAGMEIKLMRVGSGRDVRPAFRGMRDDVDAIWLLPDPEVVTPENFRYLREQARRAQIPLLATSETLVRVGAYLCVAPDYVVVAEQAADLANAVVSGTSPARLPPEAPAASRVLINRGAMEAMGIEVDEVMLDFVDEVIEEGAATGR